jgi:hypothetical protein
MASKKKMDYLSNTGGSSKQVAVKAKQAVEDEYKGMKFLGVDYFRVIYVSVAILIILMLIVYFTAEDETL